MIRKESNDKTRKRIGEALKASAGSYADYAETKVLNLQHTAYSRKQRPQSYVDSASISQRSQDVPNKRFGSRVSALFRGRREDLRELESVKATPSDDGNAKDTHGF